MKSSKLIVVTAVIGVRLILASVAWADPAGEPCVALGDARTALKLMLIAQDKPAQEALDAKVQAASDRLDSVLAHLTGTEAKGAADFRAVWDKFKATREEEIIPAIEKGKIDEAKRIANGVQYVRLSKMWSLLSCK